MRVFAEDLLAGQVALITGGGSGIGAGVARRLAEQGAKVALVGRKLDKLESSAARIRDAGVNIALGTDNMTEDLFQALKIGAIIHRGGRGRTREGGVDPQPQAVLDMITRNAARTVAAEAEIGSIEAGKKADLTLIDLDTPAMRPVINLVSNLVHYAHPGCVHAVMVDGEFLLRDGRVLSIDEPALLREAQDVTRRVWERMIAQNPDIPPPPGGLRWLEA